MRVNILILTALFIFSAIPSSIFGQNRVVVIPLIENEAIGNARSEDVLAGKTFSCDEGSDQVGTMPIIGGKNIEPGDTAQPIPKGYHDGNGRVLTDAYLIEGNIRSTVTIFGVDGKKEVVDTTENTSPVAAERMATGDIAWINGERVVGSGTGAIAATSTTIPQGYHAAGQLDEIDTDLTAANIVSGKVVFGVHGTGECMHTDVYERAAFTEDCIDSCVAAEGSAQRDGCSSGCVWYHVNVPLCD